jgi:hypothetical protein
MSTGRYSEDLLLAVVFGGAPACGKSASILTSDKNDTGETDTDIDKNSDLDTETDVDVDVDADTDTDTQTVPCYFIDLQPLWEGHPEYTAADTINPSAEGAEVIAQSIWNVMQQNCIAQ